jgi:hypothetical protein
VGDVFQSKTNAKQSGNPVKFSEKISGGFAAGFRADGNFRRAIF